MKKVMMKTAIVGAAVAMSAFAVLSASAESYVRMDKPNVKLTCNPGQLTLINRGSDTLRIQKRSGNFFRLDPNYQATPHLSSHRLNSLKIIKLKELDSGWIGKGFSVKVVGNTMGVNKFNCLIPQKCLMSLRGIDSSRNIHFVTCRQPGASF